MPTWLLVTVFAIPLWAGLGAVFFALRFGRAARRCWREPVLARPVLVVESDDWGPAPATDADALRGLAALLEAHRDADGRPAVMTIGALLGAPDAEGLRHTGFSSYRRRRLDEPAFAPIRDALAEGVRRGVFALQLHGMEHLWPPALLAAARADETVRDAFGPDGALVDPRRLPAWLQTRWVDAARLPSRPLSEEAIDRAVEEEVAAFGAVFGRPPAVAVPPTFVWTEEVERAWVRRGIEVVVTPGRRYEARDEAGRPARPTPPIHNGDRGVSGCTYVVRDAYFEPALGHSAARAVEDLAARTAMGRPTLLETHRFNFTEGDGEGAASLRELDALLRLARARFDTLAFLSTEELARALRRRDPRLVTRSPRARIAAFLRRVGELPGARRLAWVTGVAVPAGLLLAALERRR